MPADDASTAQADWTGLDPSDLEPAGKGARFVVAFAVYLLLASLGVWAIAGVTMSPSDGAEADASVPRGAPIAAGPEGTVSSGRDRARGQGPPSADTPTLINGRYRAIGFDLLASFHVPDPWDVLVGGDSHDRVEIPAYIKELHNQPVSIVGFASTHHLTSEAMARTFFLMRTQAQCCWGEPFMPNEVIACRVIGAEGLDLVDGVPIRINGTLEVVPEYHDDVLYGVYHLKAESAEIVGR